MPAYNANGYIYEIEALRGDGWNAGAYPFNLPILRGWDRLRLHEKVTFFVGENGAGKSTLIEAIAVASGFNAEGGSRNFNFGTRESHSPLHRHLRVSRTPKRQRDGFFLRAESYFNLATNIEKLDEPPGGPLIIDSFGGVSLHEMSHGQSFMALMMNRLGGKGLYILDEPEAALSPTRQFAFLSRLHQLVRDSSQFIIATHSPILLAYPDAKIFEFSERGVFETAYEDLEHVQVTKAFLNRPETFLETILADDED